MKLKYLPQVLLTILVILRILLISFSNKAYFSKEAHYDFNAVIPIVAIFHNYVRTKVNLLFPSVAANLLLGMTVGLDDIKTEKDFYNSLITTSLVHVVVVSGYNVSLVISAVNSLFKLKLNLRTNIAMILALIFYTVICGVQPPVVRAAVMGYVTFLAQISGRSIPGFMLLYTVVCFMLFIYPPYLISLSFWLSSGATFGLILFSKRVGTILKNLAKDSPKLLLKIFPFDDLATTLSCQLIVLPIISYFFGRVSIFSPIYNIAVLWLVPLCTVAGIFLLLCLPFGSVLPRIVAMLVFPIYDIFIRLVNFFSVIDRGNIEFTVSLVMLLCYYAVILISLL